MMIKLKMEKNLNPNLFICSHVFNIDFKIERLKINN
jgi:hypothetical protein